MTLLEQIIEIMESEVDAKFDNVNEDTTFDELQLDSLDMVEIIMAIEEKFDIEISDEDGENIKCIGDAVKYVEDKMNG